MYENNDEHAMAIAGALLGEEPEVTETPVVEEPAQETTEGTETVTETAEEEGVTATPEETEDVKLVPLKGQLEEKRKRQEAEARLQEYEAKLKELEEKIKPKEETDDEIYARDPQGTTSRINAEIARLTSEDPYENAARIEELRDLKHTLRENYINRQSTQASSFQTELQKAVPDIQTKTKDYSDFAMSELGYDAQTLSTLTNPKIVGPQAAINFVKTIANQYNKAQAAKTVQQKAVQPKPTTSEPPGKGIPVQTQDIGKLKAEAKASGDWSKYLDAVGAL